MGNLCTRPEHSVQKKTEMHNNNCCIKFINGDITSEKADVIVNPSSAYLQFSSSLSIDISRKGGPEISSQCLEFISDFGPIPVGEIAVTTGGSLNCKKIVHIVGPIYCYGICHESEMLLKCVDKVLELAHEKGFQSIVFPVIASGPSFFPIEEFAYVFYIALSQFNFAKSSLREVRFVNKDLDTIREFEDEFKLLVKEGVCHQEEISTENSRNKDMLNYSF